MDLGRCRLPKPRLLSHFSRVIIGWNGIVRAARIGRLARSLISGEIGRMGADRCPTQPNGRKGMEYYSSESV